METLLIGLLVLKVAIVGAGGVMAVIIGLKMDADRRSRSVKRRLLESPGSMDAFRDALEVYCSVRDRTDNPLDIAAAYARVQDAASTAVKQIGGR